MKFGNARIFHAYGPNMEVSKEKAAVMANFMRSAIKTPEKGITVYGNGEQTRCFVYIDDLVEALSRMSKYADIKGNITVNIGTTNEITINRLAEIVAKLSGKDIDIRHEPAKPQGTTSRIPDLTRVRKLLDWKPKTLLSDGLQKTYDWAVRRMK